MGRDEGEMRKGKKLTEEVGKDGALFVLLSQGGRQHLNVIEKVQERGKLMVSERGWWWWTAPLDR